MPSHTGRSEEEEETTAAASIAGAPSSSPYSSHSTLPPLGRHGGLEPRPAGVLVFRGMEVVVVDPRQKTPVRAIGACLQYPPGLTPRPSCDSSMSSSRCPLALVAAPPLLSCTAGTRRTASLLRRGTITALFPHTSSAERAGTRKHTAREGESHTEEWGRGRRGGGKREPGACGGPPPHPGSDALLSLSLPRVQKKGH